MKTKTASPASIVFGIFNLVLSLLPTIGFVVLTIYYLDMDDYREYLSAESNLMSYYVLHWALLLGPISLLSACFLLAGKRIGWSGSVISGFSHTGMLILLIYFLSRNADGWIPFACLLVLYHLLSLFFLARPGMRSHYRIDTNTIVITGGILFVLSVDLYTAFQYIWK